MTALIVALTLLALAVIVVLLSRRAVDEPETPVPAAAPVAFVPRRPASSVLATLQEQIISSSPLLARAERILFGIGEQAAEWDGRQS